MARNLIREMLVAPLSPAAVDALACSGAAAAETVILISAYAGATFPVLMVLHGIAVAGLVAYLVIRIRDECDVGLAALALVAVTSTGPIGATGCAFLAWLRMTPIAHVLGNRIGPENSAEFAVQHPAEVMANRVRAGRTLDALAPVPNSLELAITVGTCADRRAALTRLSTAYEPAFSGILQAALRSDALSVRSPGYAIFAHLLDTAFARAAALADLPIARAVDADCAVIAADSLLRRTPFGIVASPVCDGIAQRAHALCVDVLRAHPRHRRAGVVAGRALVLLQRYDEAQGLLAEVGDDDPEVIELRQECWSRLGRFAEVGASRVHTMQIGR